MPKGYPSAEIFTCRKCKSDFDMYFEEDKYGCYPVGRSKCKCIPAMGKGSKPLDKALRKIKPFLDSLLGGKK